jgi:signal transduction histidine kinase
MTHNNQQMLTEKIDALNDKAWQTLVVDPAESQKMFKQAYDLATAGYQYTNGMLKSLVGIARADLMQANYQDAMRRIKRTLTLTSGLDNPENHYLALYTLGELHLELDNLNDAYEAFRQQLALCTKINDDMGIMRAANGLGMISDRLNKNEEALEYFLEVYARAQIIGNTYAEVISLNNVASQLNELGKYDEAIIKSQQSLALTNDEMTYAQSNIHGVLALAHLNKENYTTAYDHLMQAYEVAQAYNLELLMPSHLENMGWTQHKLGNDDDAIQLLKQALQKSSHLLQHRRCSTIHEKLSAIYEEQGAYEIALLHYKRRSECLENDNLDESERRIAQLRQLHDVETLQKDRDYYEHLATIHDEAISNANHDLKTPLSRINLANYALRRHIAPDNIEATRKLDIIDSETAHVRQLIDNLLDLTHYQSAQRPSTTPHNIHMLLSQSVHAAQVQARAKEITLHYTPNDNTNLHLAVDVVSFKQMIDNLLSNALKFTDQNGEIDVSLKTTAEEAIICLTDTGIGIPQADLPHIFDRFYRATPHTHIEGSGLGLAIVQSIAQKHNAHIDVNSAPGVGTTFTITLPLRTP